MGDSRAVGHPVHLASGGAPRWRIAGRRYGAGAGSGASQPTHSEVGTPSPSAVTPGGPGPARRQVPAGRTASAGRSRLGGPLGGRGRPPAARPDHSPTNWLDNEEDATQATTDPADIGGRFGRRWGGTGRPDQRAALFRTRPQRRATWTASSSATPNNQAWTPGRTRPPSSPYATASGRGSPRGAGDARGSAGIEQRLRVEEHPNSVSPVCARPKSAGGTSKCAAIPPDHARRRGVAASSLSGVRGRGGPPVGRCLATAARRDSVTLSGVVVIVASATRNDVVAPPFSSV